jgi:hypothetical protein
MTDEPNIRRIVESATDSGTGSLDTARIIAASRARRRRPIQAITSVAAVLAIGTIAVVGVQNFGTPGASTAAMDDAAGSEESSMADSSLRSEEGADSIKRAPAERINLCTGTRADVAPSRFGLELTTSFPDTVAGESLVEGTVTMTNTGNEAVSGYTSSVPAITLSQNGTVLWHTNGVATMDAVEVNLAPGESLEYAASFSPVVCTINDDALDSFAENLPAAPSGEYDISAAIDFLGSDSADLVTGPDETVTIQ